MKQLLAIVCVVLLLASCQKVDQTAPYHAPEPCELNFGTGNLSFISQHYNLTQNYSLQKCAINLYYKSTKLHPFKTWYYTALEIKNDSISIGIDSVQMFSFNGVDTVSNFEDHLPLKIYSNQVRMVTNIADPDLYGYVSTDAATNVFQITNLTDTTISGNYSIQVSRLRKTPSGTQIDVYDTSKISGTFNNLKIIHKNID